MAFMTDGMGSLHEKFEKVKEEVFKDDPNPFTKSKTFGKKTVVYYEGKVVLAFLIRQYNKTRDPKKCNCFLALLLSMIYAIIPGLTRVNEGLVFHGDSFFQMAVFYLNFVLVVYFMTNNLRFFFRFMIDMDRRKFLLEQLGMSLTTHNLSQYRDEKYLPVVDLVS